MASLSCLIFYKGVHSSSKISIFDCELIIYLLSLLELLKMLEHTVRVILIGFLLSIIYLVNSFVRTLTKTKFTSRKF